MTRASYIRRIRQAASSGRGLARLVAQVYADEISADELALVEQAADLARLYAREAAAAPTRGLTRALGELAIEAVERILDVHDAARDRAALEG